MPDIIDMNPRLESGAIREFDKFGVHWMVWERVYKKSKDTVEYVVYLSNREMHGLKQRVDIEVTSETLEAFGLSWKDLDPVMIPLGDAECDWMIDQVMRCILDEFALYVKLDENANRPWLGPEIQAGKAAEYFKNLAIDEIAREL